MIGLPFVSARLRTSSTKSESSAGVANLVASPDARCSTRPARQVPGRPWLSSQLEHEGVIGG